MKHKLANPNVGNLLLKLSLPAIIGMMITSLYNIVDAMFVGNFVGVEAVSAVSLIFPIHVVMMAVALMIGTGAAALVSIALGAKEYEKLSSILNTSFVYGVLSSVLILLPLYYYRMETIILLGGTEAILIEADKYLKIILWGTPFVVFSMINNNLIRSEGNAKMVMFSMITAAITNVILDAILIYVYKLGIEGAAYATVAAQIVAVVVQLLHYEFGNSHLRSYFNLKKFRKNVFKDVLKIGSSSFVRHITGSLLFIIMNRLAAQFGGYVAVATVGINHRLVTLVFLPVVGVGQGLQPIVGYQYGAKNFYLVLETLKKAILHSTWIISLFSFAMLFFPTVFIGLFSQDETLIETASFALRFFVIMMPLIGFQIIGASFYQAIGKPLPALMLIVARQLVFLIPLLFVFTHFFRTNGIWYAIPISDFLTAVLAFFLLKHQINDLKKKA